MLLSRRVHWKVVAEEATPVETVDIQIIKSKYEREDVQKKTFAKWINSQLVKSNCSLINDLFVDLQDGTRLLALLEILTGKQYKREKGRMRVHHLNNVNRALQVLEHNNVKLVNISSNDIVDGNPKLILGLVWSIILHWQVHYHLKDLMSELQQTNLEKTLLAWCRQNTQNYSGVDVRNFTTSWSDGLAFNALLHHFRPDLFDFGNVTRRHPNARLDHAFRVAQEQFAIERLLDPEDVNTSVPDKKSVMMYVMCLFQSLPHSTLEVSSLEFLQSDSSSSLASPATTFEGAMGELEPRSSRPHSLATNASVELGGYQVAMEEVLTWLLEAEDRLSHDLALGSTDLETIKEHFHSHEGFLLELSGHQEGVGAVLEEGARMLSEGGLTRDEEEEVRVQMRLLNSRWEALRLKAMEKQASIHSLLMSAQQKQLDRLREWLTATEDRISRMSQVGPDLSDLQAQQKALAALRDDLQAQQKTVDSLCNLVIVVDDTTADSSYSAMEDQLAALGERWEHICQWSEERWGLLQQLITSASQLMDQVSWLQQWLLTKETTLKQMEAEPATEMGAILDRIKQLQVMRQQMDAQQKRLTGIQDAATELSLRMRPPEGGRDLEQIEALQDRWDALVLILEMQSQRISSSGFEVTPVVGDSSTTISTSLAWEETSPSEDGQGSWKRRKVEAGQTELDRGMEVLRDWLQNTLQQLQSHSDSEVLRRAREEWLQRRASLDNITRLAHTRIQEIITEGGSPEEEEKRLSELTKSYENMDVTLQHKTEEVEQRGLIESEIASAVILIEEYNQWLSATDAHDFDVCSAKIQSLKSQEDRLTSLQEKTTNFCSRYPDSEESKTIQEKVESLSSDISAVYNRLVALEQELSEPSPQAKYTEAKTNLTRWMDDVEGILLSEHVVLTYPQSMEEQLVKFQELEKNISAQQEGYDQVKAAGEELMMRAPSERLREELQDLHTRWADIPRILVERRTKLQTDIGKIQQLKDEVQNVEAWLQQAEDFLAHEKVANLPLSALQSHLQRSQDLIEEAAKLDPSIQNIRKGGEELLGSNAETTFAKEINESIKTLVSKWDSVIKKQAVDRRDGVKNVITKYNQVSNGLNELAAWLSTTEQKANTDLSSIQVPSDLSKMKGRFQSLKESVEKKTKDFNSVMKQANELISNHQGEGVEELKNKVKEIDSKWMEINDVVSKKYKFLQDANHQYGEFRALVAQEMDWLDKLEKRLKKSPKSAADAEEISEELDDLENYIRNHPDSRLSRLQELGRSLISEKMMSQSVKADVEAITTRWSQLSQQSQVVLLENIIGNSMARDRTVLLEGCVVEAQQLEGQIVLFQEWLNDVEAQLTERIDNDLTAHDLPDDVQRLVEEFETQARTLQQMEEQVRSYRAAGKHEAAARLQEQMVLLQERFNDIAEKFERFRSPSNLEPRLNRAMRELRGIEEATCLLELASEDPESIQGQLNHCKRFYQTLSEIKSEVESVIKCGRKLVEEKSVPQHYTGRLDTLKELYNKLGLQVTEAMSSLTTALELSRSLQTDIPALTSWAEGVDLELDQVEATPANHRDIQAEISFVKDTLTECERWRERKDQIKSNYRAFSTLCDPVYLEVLKDRDTLTECERWRERKDQIKSNYRAFSTLCDPVYLEVLKDRDTLTECERWRERKDQIKSNYRAFSTLCDPVYLEVLKDRVSDCVRKWERTRDKLLQAQTQLQGFTKASKSILKPSKPTKTVRIKEPSEISETSPTLASESGSNVSDSQIQKTEVPQVTKTVTPDENKESSPKGKILEGETQVKSILKNDTSTKIFVSKLEMEIPNNSKLTEPGSFVVSSENKRRSVYENVDNVETSHVIIEEPEDEEDSSESNQCGGRQPLQSG
ncbi:dystrophin-like [Macrosteles quadrilineatus]|uniref:dystrophin-like n=1 Tax=Macrosteles quadrilineatus TaxID=74068 RepID=UPI0023E30105|nr:dystrophin-like [Macrosteles quadrilineatus]